MGREGREGRGGERRGEEGGGRKGGFSKSPPLKKILDPPLLSSVYTVLIVLSNKLNIAALRLSLTVSNYHRSQ